MQFTVVIITIFYYTTYILAQKQRVWRRILLFNCHLRSFSRRQDNVPFTYTSIMLSRNNLCFLVFNRCYCARFLENLKRRRFRIHLEYRLMSGLLNGFLETRAFSPREMSQCVNCKRNLYIRQLLDEVSHYVKCKKNGCIRWMIVNEWNMTTDISIEIRQTFKT